MNIADLYERQPEASRSKGPFSAVVARVIDYTTYQFKIPGWDAGLNLFGPAPGPEGLAVGDTTFAFSTTQGEWFLIALQENPVPPGAVLEFGGSAGNIPDGYLHCDGSAVSRTTYARLFAAVGTTNGAGNGTTTFNIPNSAGKIIKT